MTRRKVRGGGGGRGVCVCVWGVGGWDEGKGLFVRSSWESQFIRVLCDRKYCSHCGES